jgi:hypothetical protein
MISGKKEKQEEAVKGYPLSRRNHPEWSMAGYHSPDYRI